MTLITLKGGLRDGTQTEINIPTPTIKAPGAYEDRITYWHEDHYVNSFPTEIYKRSQDNRSVYVYSHTDPPTKP